MRSAPGLGIGESSFYNTAKSKKALCLKCLRHYNATVTKRRWDAFAAEPSVGRGVRRFFKAVLDDLADPKVPNVCFMAGSLSADVLGAKDLQSYVVAEMRSLEEATISRLNAAQDAGELSPDFDPEVAGQVLVTYLQGLFRVVRVLKDRPQMERQIETLLTGLGL